MNSNCKKGNSWLTNYHNQVVQVTFEFDLGAKGQDKLNVYLYPDDRQNIEANATYYGYVKDKTLIYVCKDKVCLKPSETPYEALKQINNTF